MFRNQSKGDSFHRGDAVNNVSNINISANTLRQFLLITLSHAEQREVRPQNIIDQVRFAFACRAIVVSTEKSEVGGYNYHVGVFTTSASKHTSKKKRDFS